MSSRPRVTRGPWYSDRQRRRRFEKGARQRFPDLRSSRTPDGNRITYSVAVPVPHYETRQVTITFTSGRTAPAVLADGPTASPHRYHAYNGELCMWYPGDPVERRWIHADGLDVLLDYIADHLFQEAWWRETGEWPGEEAPHGASSPMNAEDVSC